MRRALPSGLDALLHVRRPHQVVLLPPRVLGSSSIMAVAIIFQEMRLTHARGSQTHPSRSLTKAATPRNCKPMCSIPPLDRLFSQLLCNQLQPELDGHHTPDQAGFRPKHATTENQFTFHQLGAHKWQGLWLAAIDLKEAFDTVEHINFWRTKKDLLQKTCHVQEASVCTDLQSRAFTSQTCSER